MNISQKEEFRYWFAGMALQALLSNSEVLESLVLIAKRTGEESFQKPEAIAVLAKSYADALIDLLDKKEEHQ